MTEPIDQPPGPVPVVITSALEEMLKQSRNLGLTWTLRMATISTIDPLTAIFDGDTIPLNVTSMTGGFYFAGQRVYVIILPPSGNFIVGYADAVVLGASCGTAESMTAGTTTSAVYVDQPGSPSVVVTKLYNATSLRFSWAQTYYTSGGDVNALFAVVDNLGTQALLAKNFIATTSGFRTPISGVRGVSGILAGTRTWTGAWAQAGGAGTLVVDAGCYWTMCVEEYWPSD